MRNISRELVDKFATVMKVGEERISNIKTVKMFSKEKRENLVFSKELEDALNIGYR